jgi:hypothetical protein
MRRIFLALAVGGLVVLGSAGVSGTARADGGDVSTVGPHGIIRYTRYFRAGEVVRIGVRGDGDTDLDLYVYCPCNRVVAKDDDDTDLCLVRFTAPDTGYYSVQVVNRGWLSNTFAIAVED